MNPELLSHLSAVIHDATHRPFDVRATTPVGGGSINEAYRLEGTDGSRYFLKLNDARHLPIPSTWLRTGFAAEAEGLNAIAATQTIHVPRPVAHGTIDTHSFLVLEYLELSSRGNAKLLGEQLAALHRCASNRFGFAHDNFIGTTPQHVGWVERSDTHQSQANDKLPPQQHPRSKLFFHGQSFRPLIPVADRAMSHCCETRLNIRGTATPLRLMPS